MSFVIIEHNGVKYRVPIANTNAGVWVGFAGGAVLYRPQKDTKKQSKQDKVVAPMTGKIIDVYVQEGQQVAADDILIVIEAMKMEYRLKAPRAGKVISVDCNHGELVDLGAVLITINT
ncbi:MAG: acetyl-CoA carboxylase biotin carboxyl carrier protein subunit [Deltaproteobacteria bacterium]|nr:acetyl-CoA carboxylase biotin carboxyl carrier protein subunit [Deltaproteobacteria bacterium]